jgi:hypothetical protein
MNAWSKLVVNGSMLGLLATMVVVGCGDDNKDSNGANNGGEPAAAGSSSGGKSSGGSNSTPNAGEPSGGTSSEAGATTGGVPAQGGTGADGGTDQGGADQGGAGGTGPETWDETISVARFCNGLSGANDANITYILEIGEGNEKVTFSAASHTCAPVDGAVCTTLPFGQEVPVVLYQEGDDEPWYEGTINSEAGDQWLFTTFLDNDGEVDFPSVEGSTTNGLGLACNNLKYSDVYETE